MNLSTATEDLQAQQLLEMRLHSVYTLPKMQIIRVVGGWIYVFEVSSTFVPQQQFSPSPSSLGGNQ